MLKKNLNPWTLDDEKEHPSSVMEWWCAITFLKSVEADKHWSFKGSLVEWSDKSKIGSVLNTTLFDQKQDKDFTYHSRSDEKKLECSTERFFAKYDDSFIQGKYPDYNMCFNDKKNNISLKLDYHSEAYPHWISHDITNGWLPMGLGFYRYGFIPKCKASGELTINNKKYLVEGKGYYEHVWGDIWYDNPLSSFSNIKETLSVYSKLAGWWIKNHKPRIPKSLKFATENNPFGYDWAWALLDNGWMIYYGNILFWLMEGPAMGALIFSKDGKKYEEFCDVDFKYNKTKYSKKFDFCYPSELEITARKENEKINLVFKQVNETREYVSGFKDGKYWKCLVICEEPGIVEGMYFDGKTKTSLSGVCKLEPQRQVSIIGHNSLNVSFLKPPNEVGFSLDFDSHFFRKKIFTSIQLAPYPKIKFNLKRKKHI